MKVYITAETKELYIAVVDIPDDLVEQHEEDDKFWIEIAERAVCKPTNWVDRQEVDAAGVTHEEASRPYSNLVRLGDDDVEAIKRRLG